MTDRKKPGVAFWATVVVVVALVLYPLSYGPAMRFVYENGQRRWTTAWDRDVIRQSIFLFYLPIRLLHSDGPQPIFKVIEWYVRLWMP